MKLFIGVFLLSLSISFSAAADEGEGMAPGDFSPVDSPFELEGIYEMQTIYRTSAGSAPYTSLDRLVMLQTGDAFSGIKFRVSLIKSFKDASGKRLDSIPFINFDDVQVERSGESEFKLVAQGSVLGGLQGKLTLTFAQATGEFSGHFTYSVAEGYKELKGRQIVSISRILRQARIMDKGLRTSDVTGFFSGRVGNEPAEMLIRNYSGSAWSSYIVFSQHARNEFNFPAGIFYPDHGGLMVFRYAPPDRSRDDYLLKLLLLPKMQDGKLILTGFTISSSGRIKKIEFTKTREVLIPPEWVVPGTP